MKLYIPALGDEIKLTRDWTFNLIDESRNETLMEFLNDPRANKTGWYEPKQPDQPATIPAGSILKIDRIYIRKGAADFSSVTFFWKGHRTKSRIVERNGRSYMQGDPPGGTSVIYESKIPAKPVRFWAKLDDVNNIEFEEA